jgi:hypothetical protein
MPEYVWSHVRDRGEELFGDTPGPKLEATLLEIFEQRPEAVIAAIEKLGKRYAAGKVRSPWPLVLREVEQTGTAEVTTTGKLERNDAIRLAETWIRNAGLYAPWQEAKADLFDERGRLHPWHHDQDLRATIHQIWLDQQPRADQAQQEAVERAERWKATNAKLQAALTDWADDLTIRQIREANQQRIRNERVAEKA